MMYHKQKEYIDAKNKKTHKSRLRELATHADYIIRYYVASNPNVPVETLNALLKDVNIWVVLNALKNPNIIFNNLEDLQRVITHFNNRGDNKYDKGITIKQCIAGKSNTSLELLNILAEDESYIVRCEVARNKKTPLEALKKLAHDDFYRIRNIVAKNPNITSELIAILANDRTKTVRASIAKNKRVSPEVLDKLANAKKSKNSRRIKQAVMKNPNTMNKTKFKILIGAGGDD